MAVKSKDFLAELDKKLDERLRPLEEYLKSPRSEAPAKIHRGKNFCVDCGDKLSEKPMEFDGTCSNCDEPAPVDAKHCPGCGEGL